MRPSRTVARAALTAALALGALPGLAGSHQPGPDRPIDAAAFRQVTLATNADRTTTRISGLDPSRVSAGLLGPSSRFSEGAATGLKLPDRSKAVIPTVSAESSWRPPKYTVSGTASFYNNGTTAMRLPPGTVIVVCGAGGCLERVINDYGPAAYTGRVIDMYKPDFFAICGCGSWSGLTEVTIKVYGVP
jgi:hypothetical protein